MKTFSVISPVTKHTEIPVSDFYICKDHMPDVDLSKYYKARDIKKHIYGRNTFTDILDQNSIEKNKTVIFDHYQYINNTKDYNVFFSDFWLHDEIEEKYRKHKEFDNWRIDFDIKQYNFNCPMSKKRPNRVLASCWLANHFNPSNFLYTQSWQPQGTDIDLFLALEPIKLQNKFLPSRWVNANFKEYHNARLFFEVIGKTIMSPTAVSIVLEPVFWETGTIITEKYVNAILAGTIPVIHGYGVYDILENMGFDVFEDLVDVDVQYQSNPVLRVLETLDNNLELLENGCKIIQDRAIKKRIENNLQVLKDYNHNFVKEHLAEHKEMYWSADDMRNPI